ncbi:MAG TPA: class I SAM-dependent methyltransferase [bacterium]|nr:class I SAM-dependent methyltransferase [bacterium]
MTDPFAAMKAAQKHGWAYFAPVETFTIAPAGQLVRRAGVHAGQHVLDVACGTGVVSVTAARRGARVSGLDFAPDLLARARQNSELAGLDIEWIEGDAEQLPFPDATFDAVLSQFGHIFAPRAEVALSEMLRALKPGGTIAFSTWPPELYTGSLFDVAGRYMPPPPPGMSPPTLWGDPNVVRQRLGSTVKDLVFDRQDTLTPALSPQHYRLFLERTIGPLKMLVESLSTSDPAKLAALRSELDALIVPYFEDNIVKQGYLITRATKV